jgi:hypothetical protein
MSHARRKLNITSWLLTLCWSDNFEISGSPGVQTVSIVVYKFQFGYLLVTNHSFVATQGLVERVVVIFYDKDHIPIEKFVFKLAVSQSYGSNLEQSSLEFALRAFLIKLTVAEPLTKPLPPGSWRPLFPWKF